MGSDDDFRRIAGFGSQRDGLLETVPAIKADASFNGDGEFFAANGGFALQNVRRHFNGDGAVVIEWAGAAGPNTEGIVFGIGSHGGAGQKAGCQRKTGSGCEG